MVLNSWSLLVVLTVRGENVRVWQFLGLDEGALPGEARVMEVTAVTRSCNTADWGIRFIEATNVTRFRLQDPSS